MTDTEMEARGYRLDPLGEFVWSRRETEAEQTLSNLRAKIS